jgi:hypothetical protein
MNWPPASPIGKTVGFGVFCAVGISLWAFFVAGTNLNTSVAYGLVIGLAMAYIWNRKMRQFYAEETKAASEGIATWVWVAIAAQTGILIWLLFADSVELRIPLSAIFTALAIALSTRLRGKR